MVCAPRQLRFAALAAALAALVPLSASAEQTATIHVTLGAVVGPVNPFVFGNNQLAYMSLGDFSTRQGMEYAARGAGIWDPDKQAPVPEFIALARQAGMTVARWPGGCEAHRYNWKLTVGPHEKRPRQPFGLPEFLTWCDAVGCRPILTVAEYWGEPQDGADLVEYLNAPDDGKHPWAALRAGDGHAAPYNVIWFEYGNESYHGDHGRPRPRIFTPEEYARRYLEYQKLMKAVDPRIRLGAVIEHGNATWDTGVLKACGRQVDFGIPHTYIPGYDGNDGVPSGRTLMQACVASDEAIQQGYDWLNDLALRVCGRRDLSWAVTEYNGSFVQEKPVPYRQSLGNALRNAENLRILMRPQNRIMCANFWQFANEYWGMVQGHVDRGEPLVKQANYYVYQLYHEHFGDTLIRADVQCGAFDFEGAAAVPARMGKPQQFKLFEPDLLSDKGWKTYDVPGVKQTVAGDAVTAEFLGQDVNYYAPVLRMPAEPHTGYRVTAWTKTEDLQSATGAAFQVGDGRGWVATKSCSLGGAAAGTTPWTKVVIDYVTLSDSDSLTIQARRLDGGGAVTGKASYRVEKVQKFIPANAGAVPYISCNAARRRNGVITLMLVNKDFDEGIATTVEIPGGLGPGARVRAWSLTGPSEDATNLGPDPRIGVGEIAAEVAAGKIRVTLPKCSLTAVEITP
jgi:alpha-N-arabinofuranosidase